MDTRHADGEEVDDFAEVANSETTLDARVVVFAGPLAVWPDVTNGFPDMTMVVGGLVSESESESQHLKMVMWRERVSDIRHQTAYLTWMISNPSLTS